MAAACQSLQEANDLRPYDSCEPTACGGPALLPRQAGSAPLEMALSSTGSGRSAMEARALRIHSEAERRRRERINAHLAALRRMIPDTKQMDKATLLARVVDQVRRLKRRASEATELTPAIPPESDEVSIECCTGDDDSRLYMKASVSCDDRPDLVAGLVRALHGLGLRTVRAEVSLLGGRVRHVFTICTVVEGSAGCDGFKSLKEDLWQALARVASPELVYDSSSSGSDVPFQSKRQRIRESHCSNMSA